MKTYLKKAILYTLAVMTVFIITYMLILPAMTIDKNTTEGQPGMELNGSAESETGLTEESQTSDDSDDQTYGESEDESDKGWEESTAEDDNAGESTDNDDDQVVNENTGSEDQTDEADGSQENVTTEVTEGEATYIKDPTVLSFKGKDYEVKASFDGKAHLPEGVRLEVKEIRKNFKKEKESYQNYYDKALEEVNRSQEEEVLELAFARFFDIAFEKDGKEIEPVKPVDITITLDQSKDSKPVEGADAATLKKKDRIRVVHFQENDHELRAIQLDNEAKLNKKKEIVDVQFESDTFSVYGIVGTTIEKTILASDGKNYKVTVTYGADAGIPENADLEVTEILQESEAADEATEYEKYIAKTQEALGLETGVFEYARFFDIKIVDSNGEKISIAAPVDVRIELVDKDISKDAASNTSVVHFADGAETGDVVEDVAVDGDVVSFETEGFSAYAIVAGPDAVPTGWKKISSFDELVEKAADGLYIGHTSGYYFTDKITQINSSRTGITKTKPAQAYPADNAVKYYFERIGTSSAFKVFCFVGEDKKYIVQSGNSLDLTDSENAATQFTIGRGNNDNEFRAEGTNGYYWNMQGGANGASFAAYNVAGDVNAQFYFWYFDSVEDPYELDNKSYGLMNWNGGAAGKALMNSSSENGLDAKALTVMSTSNNSKQLFVPNDSDISMWTFHWVEDDKYYLTTAVDGDTKYLRIDENGVSLVSATEDGCKIQVVPGTGAHAGEICLKSGHTTLTYSGNVENGFTVGGSAGTEWLNLVELSELTSEYFMTYSASKVSVSDTAITNGSRVIVYTREWNDNTKKYDFYAISSDGSLIPVYENGDSIEWVGGQINELLWNFIEHYWEDTDPPAPNYFYDLYNQYSEKYIAPQVTDEQILSVDPIGINLNGRRDGKYYSSILAWDETNYSYAGLKVENGHIVTCPKNEAMDFYFAIMEDQNVDDTLHTVDTVDHTKYGITMKIIDLENGADHKGYMSTFLGSSAGGTGTTLQPGLLSTKLGDDGYPTVYSGKSLGELYSGDEEHSLREVNHLFIESTYHASGYFEYDSTQNYAYLQDNNDFKVYKELGTYDSAGGRNTLKHGQFFPFNDLQAGVFASVNGKNLYTFDENNYQKPLPNSDPRKYEQLYSLENSKNSKVDTYFAMELDASFVQTPDGLDEWGHDIIFEFTGDDDFWLYVDGELVIDLGGIHSSVPGSVNFRTGEVKVNGTTKTLREVFTQNYISRYKEEHEGNSPTDQEISDHLSQYFEEGATVFKDDSTHNMRIFYMERGAGASNLRMRFNLTAVKKGAVQLGKELSGVDTAETIRAEFPYQIWYKKDGVEYRLQNALPNSPEQNQNYVYYKETVNPVKYQESITVDGVVYNDVFFLKPGEEADINFPEGVTEYKIIECGVDTRVFDSVTVNKTSIEGTSTAGAPEYRKDFGIAYATTDARPRVNYVNHVIPAALKTITIKKKLYDETGVQEISNDEDQTPFSFRLYLASEFEDLDVVNMHTYHVKDEELCYCMWDAALQEFVKIINSETGEGVTNYNDLTDAQKQACSVNFTTSGYGSIGKIPAGYTVEIRDVLVGTKYRVEERPVEIPDGYSFQKYEGYDTDHASEKEKSEINGVEGTVVTDGADPHVEICNLKGWGLRVNKIWTDADFMSSREPTYFAVFIDENDNHGHGDGDGRITLVENTVRRLEYGANPQTLYWYFDTLRSGTSFEKYIIREVRLTGEGWTVDSEGKVNNISASQVHSIHHGGELGLNGTQKGEGSGSEFKYTVTYEQGNIPDGSNVRVDTVTNSRSGIMLKKAQWDGITPLPGATFTLEDENKNLIGTFISDAEGVITIASLREDVFYTLTETSAPQGWYGLQGPLSIKLHGATISVSGSDSSWYIVDNHSASPTLTVKDRPYTFQAVKKDGDTQAPMANVTFSLYKQIEVGGVISFVEMEDYKELRTDIQGIIPKIDNTLPAGTYELRETTPSGYQPFQPFNGKIRFTVSSTGAITMISTVWEPTPDGVTLTGPIDSGDGTMSYLLTILNYKQASVTLKKVDDANVGLKGAKFKLCKHNTSTWEVFDGYGEVNMGDTDQVVLENLTSGLYWLEEMEPPDGYVIISDDTYFNIAFDASGNMTVTLTDNTGTGPNPNSDASIEGTTITVRNHSGAALPNTGGIGTNLFHILGSILFTGAGILLTFLRRRLD